MKKIYIAFLFILQVFSSNAQFNPNNFEARLVLPGGLPGVMRIQLRAIAGVLPTTDDVCHDLSIAIWWDTVAHPYTEIRDLDVVTLNTYGGELNESSPTYAPSSGSGPPNGRIVAFSLNNPFQFPTNWVSNQWVNIADVSICTNNNCNPPGYPPGMDASDFLIQGFTGTLPNLGINGVDDYTPTNAPLPLDLIAFHAQKSGERNAHLTWITANEENTSHFVVQRSFDKNTWTDVGTVGAAGNSIDIRNYELTDLEVSNGRSSTIRAYYRLKMVDLDGRTKLSPIESVIFSGSDAGEKLNAFEVFPNPADEGLYVTWDKQENLDQPSLLELYDITGKLVYRQVVSDQTTQEYIDLASANVQSGVYMLRILNGAEPLDHKQVVVGQNR